PEIAGVATALAVDQRPGLIAINGNTLNVNVGSTIINAVNAVVADEVSGEVHLNEYDQQLLALIRDHAGDRGRELASAVHELADESAPKAGRLLARQTLKGFVFATADKVGNLATGLLESYLERKFGL